MAVYRVRFLPHAKRELDRLQEPAKTRVERAIAALTLDPRPSGARLVAGTKRPTWRIRIGDYRVLYEIRPNELVILVVGAGHRRDVYRHHRISEIAAARYEAYRRAMDSDHAADRLGDTDPAVTGVANR